MVWNPSTEEGIAFTLDAGDLEHRTLEVLSFVGHEAISTPFRYELELVSDQLAIDPGPLLQKPALIRVKQRAPSAQKGIVTFKTHGRIASFEYMDGTSKHAFYRAVFVPRLWFLSLVTQCRIFLDKTVPEIVGEVLAGHGLSGPDVDFRLIGSYPKREYVVQYEESDLNFVSRLLEHEGIFYYFEHGTDTEKIVLGDSPGAYGRLEGGETYPFRPEQNQAGVAGDLFDEPAVYKLVYRQRHVPKSVTLQDYNWRTPRAELKSQSEVVSHGIGELYEYGDHYKDPGEGAQLVKVRAQEIACRERTFDGTGHGKSFRPGCLYSLEGHFRHDFNTRYLLTKVTHRGEQAISLTGPARPMAKYQNEFVSIPADAEFRPERVTPKPKITGAITAWVDAAGDGKYAEIDDLGRYKVQIGFDRAGKGGATASRHVRMAQPHAGADMGIHFPLRKETEVLLLHVNGDPDRPFIAGAMADPEAKSPVIGENQTQNVIRTGGGTEIRIEDTEDNQYFHLKTPNGNTHFSVGAPHKASPFSPDGFVGMTEKFVSLNAGKSVSFQAGAKTHEEGCKKASEALGTIKTLSAALTAALAIADFPSSMTALTVLGVVEGAGKVVSALSDSDATDAYLSAPGCSSVIGVLNTLVGSIGTSNVIGVGAVNIMSAGSLLMSSVMKSTNVANFDVEIISGQANVKIRTGPAFIGFPPFGIKPPGGQNIELEAAEKVLVNAVNDNYLLTAKTDVEQEATTGAVWLWTGQKLPTEPFVGVEDIDSLSMPMAATKNPHLLIYPQEKQTLSLMAGKCAIVLKEDTIKIQADKVVLETNDGSATLTLANKDKAKGANFFAESEADMKLLAAEAFTSESKDKMVVKGKNELKVSAKEQKDTSEKIVRSYSEEKA